MKTGNEGTRFLMNLPPTPTRLPSNVRRSKHARYDRCRRRINIARMHTPVATAHGLNYAVRV